MKKLLIAFLAFASTTAVVAQKKVTDVAKFDTETYDFGKVKQSVPPTATFTVTNISNEPLIIEQANPTCGCTVSDYTKTPIAPGKTGVIHATYNAAAVGPIHKTLTVKFANVDAIEPINLTGEVMEPAAFDTWAAANKTEIKMKDNGDIKTVVTTKTDDATTKSVRKSKRKKSVEKSTVKS